MDSRVVAIAVLAAVAAGCLARTIVRQPVRLATRVQPYTAAHRRALGTVRPNVSYEYGPRRSGVQLVFGPLIGHGITQSIKPILRNRADGQERALAPLRERMLASIPRTGAVAGTLEMLVLQAVESVRLWTGREPPVDVMRNAARSALGL